MQEAVEGVRVPDQIHDEDPGWDPLEAPGRALKAEGPGVQFWDSRAPAGPRLVWTNAARGTPARRNR